MANNEFIQPRPGQARSGELWTQDSGFVKKQALKLAEEGKLVEAIDRVITGYVERTDESSERSKRIRESMTLRGKENLTEAEVIEYIEKF